MPYRRRAYRRGRYGSRGQVLCHQKAFSFTAQAGPTTTAQLIVPSSATEGMRKVKHLTVNLTPILDQDGGRDLVGSRVCSSGGQLQAAFNLQQLQHSATCMSLTSTS